MVLLLASVGSVVYLLLCSTWLGFAACLWLFGWCCAGGWFVFGVIWCGLFVVFYLWFVCVRVAAGFVLLSLLVYLGVCWCLWCVFGCFSLL